jgi:DNA-binding protein H-NS
MIDLQELLRQKADIERKIAQAQSQSRQSAIDEIRRIMLEQGLTAADIAAAPTARATTKSGAGRKAVAVKYKDGNGNAWTGRGLKPKWLTAQLAGGKTLEDFAV